MRAAITTPVGGVMTHEAGAITGEVEVWLDGRLVRVTYTGSTDTYTVAGSPVGPDATVEQVAQHLRTDPGTGPDGNARPSDVAGLT